jgi:hypothetical protein
MTVATEALPSTGPDPSGAATAPAAVAALPDTEAEIVLALLAQITKLGDVSGWAAEVPSHGRSRADVCLVIDNAVWAIEAKRGDWKRALAQASMNRFAADESYVALWEGRIPAAAVTEARRCRVGIIAVSPADVVVVLSSPRGQPDATVRRRILERIETTGTP